MIGTKGFVLRGSRGRRRSLWMNSEPRVSGARIGANEMTLVVGRCWVLRFMVLRDTSAQRPAKPNRLRTGSVLLFLDGFTAGTNA
jgi:hypothetical protein